MAEVYRTRRPRRRGGRFLLVLIVLAGLVVALDRVGPRVAERVISDRVAAQLVQQRASSDPPQVAIEGIPFLTQIFAGRYQEIKIDLANFSGPAGDRQIKLPLLAIKAQDVRASVSTLTSGTGDIVVSRVTGTATIDYAQLVSLINQPGLRLSAKDGKLIGSAPVTALGQTFNLSGAAQISVQDGVVQVRFSHVTAAGLPDVPLVRDLIDSYVKKLSVDVKVPKLPLNLALRDVQPLAGGLEVSAAATEVPLTATGA